jgi:hypothetical protein
MQIIDIPTEQTTAFTDILLAFVAIIGTIGICRSGFHIDRKKTTIWVIAFIMLALAAGLGAFAHGVIMSDAANQLIWQPLNLFLGLSVAFFVVGVIYDLQGFKVQKSLILLLIVICIAFYLITLLFPGLFYVFIIYEGIAMLFALISYSLMFLKRKLSGAFFMSAGVFISIFAAILQAVESLQFNFIWKFDHNGLFHIFQIFGLLFLFLGLIKEFLTRTQTHKT